MNERDAETFARFSRCMALIESEIRNPPPLDASYRDRSTARIRSSRRAGALAAVALVAVVVVLAPVITSRTPDPLQASVPGGAANSAAVLGGTVPSASSGAAHVPLDPASPPEEPSGPCLNHTTIYDRMVSTIEQDASMSSAVVVGTATGIGKARWNTEDGRRPPNEHLEPSQVLRLIRVNVETVVTGTAPAVITVQIPGGLIGCHGFFVGGFVEPRIGSRYVWFIGRPEAERNLEDVVGAWQMWPIEGDQVSTSFDGIVPLATVIDRARGG